MPRSRWRWSSLSIAASAASLMLAPLVVQAQTSPQNVHVVRDGETLSQIALDANTDAATVAALNGLSDANVLSVGQSLKLPSVSVAPVAAAPGATSYTVGDGDTLWDIAQRFGTSTDAIVQLNHLDDPDHLSLGTVLSLPTAARASAASSLVSSPSPTPSTSANPTPPKRNVIVSYTVQPGETLTQIAHQFDVRSDAIVQATNLDDANKIVSGAVLKVPVPARAHTVNAGETLRDIAASEKVDLGSLIDFNQLDDPELIHVGQTVLLPVAANAQVATATTASSGDPQVAAVAVPASAAPASGVANSAPAPTAAPPKPTSVAASAASAPATAPKPTAPPKPVAPVAVVAPPPGAPTDGLAGAGLKFLGSPYVWGGSSPGGFDCSGFVWYVAKQTGKSLTRGMFGQYNSGSHPGRDQLQVGDLVFFQNTFSPGLSHNGIYIGNGQFVHAADEAAGVTISSLNTAYWSSHWFGATRLP